MNNDPLTPAEIEAKRKAGLAFDSNDEEQAAAIARAEDDGMLLQALRQRAQEQVEEVTEAEATRPLNRAERRAMVAEFKENLRSLPRARPFHNTTIRDKARRRRRRR